MGRNRMKSPTVFPVQETFGTVPPVLLPLNPRMYLRRCMGKQNDKFR